MGRRSFVVHIGPPKTGSTSIQRMLWTLARPLGRCGIHVPIAGQDHGGAHSALANEYRGNRTYGRWLGGWPDLRCELSERRTARCFVISSEAFACHRRGIPRVAAVAEACDLDVEVIGYVRPQDQLIESHYSQNIKNGGTDSFEAFQVDALSRPDYDYNVVLRSWREAFGDRLKIYPLDDARMPAGILPHFLDVIGASGLAVAAAALPRVNRRIGAKHLAMMRLINMALAREMTDHALRVRVRRRLTQTLPGVLGDDAPFVGLDGERRLAVRRHFADSNARLAGEYGIDDGCPAGGCFWTMPGEVDVPPIRIGWADLTPEERAAVTQLARDTAGVDLASMSDRVDDTARTGPRRGRPSRPIRRAEPAGRAAVDAEIRCRPGIWIRRWLLIKQVLRHTVPGLVPRLVRGAKALAYRYWMIRSLAARLLSPIDEPPGDSDSVDWE